MDYFCFIQSTVSYIENRVKSDIDKENLEKITGFSLPHIRDVFKLCTKVPLAKYILYRRISNAAFEMIHSDKNILNIALEYGFDSYDTFTRAFKRYTGVTPREFKRQGFQVGRIKLSTGMYGPGIMKDNKSNLILLNSNHCREYSLQQPALEDELTMKTMNKTVDSCILFGVPKVQYCYEECTPFPSVLKACLNYMGQEINYSFLMAATGASFRLRWNTKIWDGGNVAIEYIYENYDEAYERAFRAAGRSYQILKRKPDTKKEDFIRFIRSEIDMGRPVIAIGIIGPPEACIITGYRDNGETLLGWNFFQGAPEFNKDVLLDESGYFITKSWWENPFTIALMAIGEEKVADCNLKDILINALSVLTKEKIGDYAGGQKAFDAWANSLSDESQFPKDAVLPMLFERLMCQQDAMTMIAEGRSYAAFFMEWLGSQFFVIKELCDKAASYFKMEADKAVKMNEFLGGWEQGEKQARSLGDKDARKGIISLILEAKTIEAKANELIREMIQKL